MHPFCQYACVTWVIISLLSPRAIVVQSQRALLAPFQTRARCAFIGALPPAATASSIPSSRICGAPVAALPSWWRSSAHGPRCRHRGGGGDSAQKARRNDDMRDEIEIAARERAYESRARGGGVGETAAGVILGGILGGPFGALFGAQIGSAFGSSKGLNDARLEEMKRKGVTPDMLEMATEVGRTLEQAVEGLRATRESVDTTRQLAKLLDGRSESIYKRARDAIESGEEVEARKLLLEREGVKEKLLRVLKSVAEDQKRLGTLEGNVEVLEARALEIESLLRRSVGAATSSAINNSYSTGFSLEPEDPLLQKFRDLEK